MTLSERDPMQQDHTAAPIVVGVDGSKFSVPALRWAITEAGVRDCEVHVLQVWHAVPVVAAGRQDPIALATTLAKAVDPETRQRLDDVIATALGDQADEETKARVSSELRQGSPAEELITESAHAQLLVLGSHGRNVVTDAIAGSVVAHCLRRSHCPVVLIPVAMTDEDAQQPRTAHPVHGFGPLL